jgi:hypothetical protein
MPSQVVSPTRAIGRRISVAVFSALVVQLALACSVSAALESGVYQAIPGATIEERGDRVPNNSRVMPISASLTVDLSANPPSLTAVIPNAVLEGGDPFALTVRSSYGAQLSDGSYRFLGDYLGDINPTGSQYGFEWNFSESTNGQVVWDGMMGWFGGHIWQVTISDIALVPQARLSALQVAPSLLQISWSSNFTDHVLEYAPGLSAAGWNAVTNSVASSGDHFSVTVNTDIAARFYRLRKP